MRRTIPLLAALITFAAFAVPAEAQPDVQDRYCLQGRTWGYPGNCQFSTYEQCMATASGTHSYCGINPQWAFARQRRYQAY